jgi:hypothetical protein
MTDKYISDLIINYDLLFSNYNTNKEQLREGNIYRKDLLNTLYNLEFKIELAVLAEKSEKNKPKTNVVDYSQDISDLKQLRDRILKSNKISSSDDTEIDKYVHAFENGTSNTYYLYKKEGDLYYKVVSQGYGLNDRVVKELTSLTIIMGDTVQYGFDIKKILEILQEYVKTNKIPETAKQSGVIRTAYDLVRGVNPFSNGANGGKRIAASAASAYKSTGDKVHLFIDNKRLHRSIYVKGKAKYCKINNEFVLLSKLKNKIIE